MQFTIDHDYHIHSRLSECSSDPGQTAQRILQYAKEHGYRRICLTDHFWDETVEGASTWYAPQNYPHIRQNLPLPQTEGITFLFGAETEMTKEYILGISAQRCRELDFIIIPISHFHMEDFTISREDIQSPEGVAECFLGKLEAVLNMPLPFHKVGLAHLANWTLGGENGRWYRQVLQLLSGDDRLRQLFTKAAALGVGIELNTACLIFADEAVEQAVLDFYAVAKQCGCKFYVGSDAHHPEDFAGKQQIAEYVTARLELSEEDKFHIGI